jgi:hypothetical protein
MDIVQHIKGICTTRIYNVPPPADPCGDGSCDPPPGGGGGGIDPPPIDPPPIDPPPIDPPPKDPPPKDPPPMTLADLLAMAQVPDTKAQDGAFTTASGTATNNNAAYVVIGVLAVAGFLGYRYWKSKNG